MNFAKYIVANILRKFKYFAKQILFLNSPARKPGKTSTHIENILPTGFLPGIFQGGKIYCYVNFCCYANFSIIF